MQLKDWSCVRAHHPHPDLTSGLGSCPPLRRAARGLGEMERWDVERIAAHDTHTDMHRDTVKSLVRQYASILAD
jgi:hypothetical protein